MNKPTSHDEGVYAVYAVINALLIYQKKMASIIDVFAVYEDIFTFLAKSNLCEIFCAAA
jgi:hypothetical protein